MPTTKTLIHEEQIQEPETASVFESPLSPGDIKDLTLFEHLLQIGEVHEKSGGVPEAVFEAAKPSVNFVCDKLELTAIQAVLFADLLCAYEGDAVSMRKIAEAMHCKPVEVYKYLDEFVELERKNLVLYQQESRRRFHDSGLSFEIPLETLNDIQKGNRPKNLWTEKVSPDEFLERVEKLCSDRLTDTESYDQTLKKFGLLMESNRHLDIVGMLASYGLSKENELLLLRFCLNCICADEDEMEISAIENFYQHRMNCRRSRFELKAGKHVLQQKNLIAFANQNGFAQRESYCLTDKAKDDLLGDFAETLGKKTIRNLIDVSSIPEKHLFYPTKTARSVRELSELLLEENWRRVRENLASKGLRTGFACLFSGGPGTGKTETARQIARATGRGIIQVDISDTKSMWFGESEKRIKAVFNRYRAAVKSSEMTPILLFNEADAVIGKRQELSEQRRGPGQTENAIQNIILQEMENLDGILIATTNLTQNMDKAFERRFLYKIAFEKPTLDARKSIWQTQIPELSEQDAEVLAEKFDFSGGQIENISRRRTVSLVLLGTPPSLEDLTAFCEEEQAVDNQAKRIGFAV